MYGKRKGLQKNSCIIRLFSVLFITILSFSLVYKIFFDESYNSFKVFPFDLKILTILNFIGIVLFIILLINPKKIFIISVFSFLYAFYFLIFEPYNQFGILMAFLCYYSLYFNKYFFKNTIKRTIIFCLVLIIPYSTQLRFGMDIFLNSFLNLLIGFSICMLIIYFCRKKQNIITSKSIENKIINLNNYSGTKKDDTELLNLVLNNKQYTEIAQIVKRTEGTVRNRLNILYDILNVADKVEFIFRYYGYTIIYDENICNID